MSERKIVGNYLYFNCSCGTHLLDMFDEKWNDPKLGFYHCNTCNKPLLCRREDGHFYLVGEKII